MLCRRNQLEMYLGIKMKNIKLKWSIEAKFFNIYLVLNFFCKTLHTS